MASTRRLAAAGVVALVAGGASMMMGSSTTSSAQAVTDRAVTSQTSATRADLVQTGVARTRVSEAGIARAGVARARVAQAGIAQAEVARAGVRQAGIARAGVAQAGSAGERVPAVEATCLLPLLPCGDEPPPPLELPDLQNPLDNLSDLPIPLPLGDQHDKSEPDHSRESPEPTGSQPRHEDKVEHPWKPVDESERRMPQGHPETGGGGLLQETPVWPFAAGGAALLAGAGMAGFAVRRGKGIA
jgi:hypothetical protein